MSHQSDQELIREAKSFNLHALGEIYDLFSPGLFGYAMRLLGDECLAEDCVAETFSRFLKSLRAGQGPEEYIQAYLYRIAHNWITDFYRRQPPQPLELSDDLVSDPKIQPEPQTDYLLEKKRVRLALWCLTADQRQVILLRFFEGCGYEEVAEAVQKPVSAVKALQHRALAALRKYLSGEEKDSVYEHEHGI